ncbi:Rid family detoxifying hydrolase [Sinorhizobium sp. 8-89]|uniref:Rid family detoxifying hydrolase n=1 Tax=Sinorhizobium sp. 7-81 TaxID=3049087 RepID=UPI0024C2C82C|nr:Rid family detoxifying hydrolase [Sinorhizobium sp. 7-81]MDK1384804.1 Rid family detoxifying hydrolase [Sinorhizobium sp. 7-81]
MIEAVTTSDAPGAIGPFSQAIKVGSLLFVSGQLPIDPATGEFVSNDPVEQARQCLKNIAAIAEAAGSGIQRTVKTTVLLTDLSRFADINNVYATFFPPLRMASPAKAAERLP